MTPEEADVMRELLFAVDERRVSGDSHLIEYAQQLLAAHAEDQQPITEEWAATVRGDGVELAQSVDPRVPLTWFLEYHNDCGWVTARCWVKTRGQVQQILNAVRPQKEGAE